MNFFINVFFEQLDLEETNRQKEQDNDWFWTPSLGNFTRNELMHSNITVVPENALQSLITSNLTPSYTSESPRKRLLYDLDSAGVPPKVWSKERKTLYRLVVIRQPEEQHRARYLSEGSRGAIKDRTGTSNCTIQVRFVKT